MDIPALQSAPLLADLSLDRLAANPNLSEEEKVTGLARQFEAVLLRQILAAARKTVIPSEWCPDSATSGIYQDMVNSQLADAISQSGDFGVARSLQAQLVHETLPGKPTPAAAGPPLPVATTHPLKVNHD
jgi:flagellar protein FlgJ